MEMHAREPRVHGEAILFRLYDVGYEIRLEQAAALLASSAPQRPTPVRGEAQAIRIPNPPVTVGLGSVELPVGGAVLRAELSARIFDFGVVSLRARLPLEPGLAWSDLAALGAALGSLSSDEPFATWRDRLLDRIHGALDRPGRAPVTEEYTIFRLSRIERAEGGALAVGDLADEQIAHLLLGESRPLSATAQKDMVSARFSYFEDDLTVLTWNAALVVEPLDDEDVQYVLEFANAQLLELRYSDFVLDDELPRIYDEVGAARRAFHLLGRRFSRLLATLQTRVADSTESIERVENSLKVTDDVFLARIYTTALEIFRGPIWRKGIDRKMGIVRDTYAMLNAESQALRTEVLEVIIVVLILLEIVLALWRH